MNPTLDPEFALDVCTKEFSHANALALARFSQQAYVQTSVGNLDTGAACYIAERDNALVFAFRGSRSIQDFICDADFPRVATVVGNIHAGFSRDIMSILSPLLQAARAMVARGDYAKPIIITGHSLGGALAILCARLFYFNGIPVHAVYTFGQPRVGDKNFAARYDAAGPQVQTGPAWPALGDITFRVVNQCDIVPRVPGLLCGFRNVGQKYFLSAWDFLPANPVVRNPKLWLLLLSDAFGLWNEWANKKQLALLDDHFINAYINELAITKI